MQRPQRPGSSPALVATLAALVLLAPAAALAYVDPGTGSFVIQGIIARSFSPTFSISCSA